MPDVEDQYYNSDDALNRSPQLQAINVPRSPLPSPPPFPVPKPQSSSPSVVSSKSWTLKSRKRKHKRSDIKILPNQGEAVVLRHLAPDYPDIANPSQNPDRFENSSDPSSSESDSSTDGSISVGSRDIPDTELGKSKMDGPIHGPVTVADVPRMGPTAPISPGLIDAARNSLGALPTIAQINKFAADLPTPGKAGFDKPQRPPFERRRSSRNKERMEQLEQFRASPRRSTRFVGSPKLDAAAGLAKLKSRPTKRREFSSETLATSPTLKHHLIQPSQAPPQRILPALDPAVRPNDTSGTSPPVDQNLPPLQVLLDEAAYANAPEANNNRPRTSSYSSVGNNPTLSPNNVPGLLPSALESPSQASVHHSHRTSPSITSRSPPEMRSGPSPIMADLDQASLAARRASPRLSRGIPTFPALPSTSSSSGTSHPSVGTTASAEVFTPVSHSTPMHRQASSETPGSTVGVPPSNYTQYPAAPLEGYKCTYDGCTAPPFSTQYLLNSHANVHSHERPYFCKVKTCPRSEGGRGFKRKNELIRHGLVHDSPGYICPFCPDKEHRYPRPDNLQRHVRMHHEDKDKNDPRLREVLSQRPTTGGVRGPRGRRARKSS